MSRGLPVVSGAVVAKALQPAGFAEAGRRGSHVKLRDHHGRTVIVPLRDELARGTLGSILRPTGLIPEEFVALLR